MVVGVCTEDHANYAFLMTKALQTAGVDAMSFCTVEHPFGYEESSTVIDTDMMLEVMRDADVIQIMHSDPLPLRLLQQLPKKDVVVYHTGSRYRQDSRTYNIMFKGIRAVIALAEFSETSDGIYIPPCIDTNKLQADFTDHGHTFAHYPSNVAVKGSDVIKAVIPEVEFSPVHVSHEDNLERMRACDIYVEMFKLKLGAASYGSFGMTALEAAALGKVVVSSYLWKEYYESNFGELGLKHVKSLDDLAWVAEDLRNTDLMPLKEKSRQWAERHSFEAIGNFTKQKLRL